MVVRVSYVLLLAFIGTNLYSTFADQDLDQDTCGAVCLKLVRRSGKAAIVRCGKGKKKDYGQKRNYEKAMTIEMGYLKQLDKDGKSVGRAVDSFDKQNFSFSKLNRSASYQGIKAVHVSLKAYLKVPKAWLHMTTYIFCEAGNVTFGNETFEVESGTLKFFIKLDNFTFCDGNKTDLCEKNEKGEFGEIALVVKSRKGKPPKKDDNKGGDGDKKKKLKKMRCHSKRCPRSFNFGDGDDDDDEMVAATMCKKDGKFVNMSGDYPKMERKGGKDLLVFRVPKFVDSVLIDPGMTLSENVEDEEEPHIPTEPSEAASIQFNVSMFVVMATALFMFM